MESKKTFGEYIRERRKVRGLTQREFADQLYVTESAVSKWERGLSYPDITLLLDICAALDVTEHELLTASEDTNKRAAERLAEKYRRLTRSFCVFMCFLFGGVLIGCGVAASVNRNFWILPIAAAAVMIAAAVTVLPFLLARMPAWEPYKWAVSLGGMVLSGELLLLFCCAHAGSMRWFPMVSMWILTASSFLLLPAILSVTPLPPAYAKWRASLYFAADLVLLLLTLFVMAWDPYSKIFAARWFAVAASAVCFGVGFLAFPVFLRQLPLPEPLCRCKTSLFLGIQSALLLLLLTACCRYAGGAAWDVCPTVLISVLFGLSVVFLPIPLRQLPLPGALPRHKALVYFAVNTALLFVLLAVTTGSIFLSISVPTALVELTLPWGLLGIIRYLPVNRWFKTSLSCAWTGLWIWLTPWLTETVAMWQSILRGYPFQRSYQLRIPYDLSRWTLWDGRFYQILNIEVLVLMGLGVLAAIFAAAGIVREVRRRQKNL